MEGIVLNNKIVIFGEGDLAKEFASSANFNPLDILFINKELDAKLDYNQLINAKNIFIAIAEPNVKKKIHNRLKSYNIKVDTFISEHALVSKNAVIGEGSIIQSLSILSNNVVIEELTFVNFSCIIGHDVLIGKYSSLMPSVNLGGHVKIGDSVFIGTGATVIPNKTVMNNVKIGAGSILISSAKKIGTYFGNPAKRIS